MEHFDFAFLADFAKVEPTGTLTAVGGGWTEVHVMSFPAVHRMAIAGRLRGSVNEPPLQVRITIVPPSDGAIIGADFSLGAQPNAKPYCEDRIGHLFALNTQVPLLVPGVYSIEIAVNGDVVRVLKFEAVEASA